MKCKVTGEEAKVRVNITIGIALSVEDLWMLVNTTLQKEQDSVLPALLGRTEHWLGLPDDWSILCSSCETELEMDQETRVKNHYE